MTTEKKIDDIAQVLRGKIKDGAYGDSGRLPPVATLAKEMHMSRTTAYVAIDRLQAEGLLYAKEKSFYVMPQHITLEGLTKNFRQTLIDLGLTPKEENLSTPELVAMPEDIARLFGQIEGVHVVHRIRRQGIDGLSLRVAENWYPAPLAGQFLSQMATDDHMDVLLAIKEAHGVYITQVEDVVSSRLPTQQEMEWMALVRTEPIVEIRRINRSSAGTPIMFNRIIHRAHAFKFTYRYPASHWGK